MRARDFILQTRTDLQEKSEHWRDEELLLKLQRAYISLQFDLPCFVARETLAITEGTTSYYLNFPPLKNISMVVDGVSLAFTTLENFYAQPCEKSYTFENQSLLLGFVPLVDTDGVVVYKHAKELANENCEVEIPITHHKALRLLFLSEIHEKPTRNSKERVLSLHYLKLYEQEMMRLKVLQPIRAKNITSNYQRI